MIGRSWMPPEVPEPTYCELTLYELDRLEVDTDRAASAAASIHTWYIHAGGLPSPSRQFSLPARSPLTSLA